MHLLEFLKHQEVHKDDFPYQCPNDSCKRKFKTQSEFRAHRRVSHKSAKATAVSPAASAAASLASAALSGVGFVSAALASMTTESASRAMLLELPRIIDHEPAALLDGLVDQLQSQIDLERS